MHRIRKDFEVSESALRSARRIRVIVSIHISGGMIGCGNRAMTQVWRDLDGRDRDQCVCVA